MYYQNPTKILKIYKNNYKQYMYYLIFFIITTYIFKNKEIKMNHIISDQSESLVVKSPKLFKLESIISFSKPVLFRIKFNKQLALKDRAKSS